MFSARGVVFFRATLPHDGVALLCSDLAWWRGSEPERKEVFTAENSGDGSRGHRGSVLTSDHPARYEPLHGDDREYDAHATSDNETIAPGPGCREDTRPIWHVRTGRGETTPSLSRNAHRPHHPHDVEIRSSFAANCDLRFASGKPSSPVSNFIT